MRWGKFFLTVWIIIYVIDVQLDLPVMTWLASMDSDWLSYALLEQTPSQHVDGDHSEAFQRVVQRSISVGLDRPPVEALRALADADPSRGFVRSLRDLEEPEETLLATPGGSFYPQRDVEYDQLPHFFNVYAADDQENTTTTAVNDATIPETQRGTKTNKKVVIKGPAFISYASVNAVEGLFRIEASPDRGLLEQVVHTFGLSTPTSTESSAKNKVLHSLCRWHANGNNDSTLVTSSSLSHNEEKKEEELVCAMDCYIAPNNRKGKHYRPEFSTMNRVVDLLVEGHDTDGFGGTFLSGVSDFSEFVATYLNDVLKLNHHVKEDGEQKSPFLPGDGDETVVSFSFEVNVTTTDVCHESGFGPLASHVWHSFINSDEGAALWGKERKPLESKANDGGDDTTGDEQKEVHLQNHFEAAQNKSEAIQKRRTLGASNANQVHALYQHNSEEYIWADVQSVLLDGRWKKYATLRSAMEKARQFANEHPEAPDMLVDVTTTASPPSRTSSVTVEQERQRDDDDDRKEQGRDTDGVVKAKHPNLDDVPIFPKPIRRFFNVLGAKLLRCFFSFCKFSMTVFGTEEDVIEEFEKIATEMLADFETSEKEEVGKSNNEDNSAPLETNDEALQNPQEDLVGDDQQSALLEEETNKQERLIISDTIENRLSSHLYQNGRVSEASVQAYHNYDADFALNYTRWTPKRNFSGWLGRANMHLKSLLTQNAQTAKEENVKALRKRDADDATFVSFSYSAVTCRDVSSSRRSELGSIPWPDANPKHLRSEVCHKLFMAFQAMSSLVPELCSTNGDVTTSSRGLPLCSKRWMFVARSAGEMGTLVPQFKVRHGRYFLERVVPHNGGVAANETGGADDLLPPLPAASCSADQYSDLVALNTINKLEQLLIARGVIDDYLNLTEAIVQFYNGTMFRSNGTHCKKSLEALTATQDDGSRGSSALRRQLQRFFFGAGLFLENKYDSSQSVAAGQKARKPRVPYTTVTLVVLLLSLIAHHPLRKFLDTAVSPQQEDNGRQATFPPTAEEVAALAKKCELAITEKMKKGTEGAENPDPDGNPHEPKDVNVPKAPSEIEARREAQQLIDAWRRQAAAEGDPEVLQDLREPVGAVDGVGMGE